MALPTILPTQGPDPYHFGKVNLGEALGKGIQKGAKALSKLPKKKIEKPVEPQKAIEHKPMLALPPGKEPVAAPRKRPKLERRYGVATLPGGEKQATSWTTVARPERPLSASQQLQAKKAEFAKSKQGNRALGKPSEALQKKQELTRAKQTMLRGGAPAGDRRQLDKINSGLRSSSATNSRASNMRRSPNGRPLTPPGSKPATVRGSKPIPRNSRTR